MHLRELIFSFDKRPRLMRHIIFWVTWWLYLSITKWYDERPVVLAQYIPTLGPHIFLKTFLLLIIQAIACYLFIYFLMPRYLVNSKWLKLFSGIFLIGIFISTASLIIHWKIFPLVDFNYYGKLPRSKPDLLWISISNGLLNSPKIVASAAAIKLIQYWRRKQKEKELLEKEKMITEIQLLKAQIRPVFLFNALNTIYAFALATSPRAPEMLLKLSDLLSYMLYECDKPLVPIAKEIEMMKTYMMLEKIRCNENLDMEVSVKGVVSGRQITPFLLLPFIENSIKHCNNMTEQPWLNIEIKLIGNSLSMKLINSMSSNLTDHLKIDDTELWNVQKRLTLLYPGRHELKMSIEQEMMVVLLNIQVDDLIPITVAGQHSLNQTMQSEEQA